MDLNDADIMILKGRLQGSNLKNLLIAKKLTKYSVAKGCGITYRTLLNWEQKKVKPSDDNAIIVGRFLGLIKPDKAEKFKLQQDINKLQEKLNRID